MRLETILLHSRKEKGFTQQELAHKVGLSTKTISRWENGSHNQTFIH